MTACCDAASDRRWVLLVLCVASLLFLIIERLDGIAAILCFKKEIEPCNTK
jgi:hypothetical protein